mgnify:CR=1 FL=1
MNVADVMTRQVVSVAPDTTVEAAAKTMLERGMSGLFVVDDENFRRDQRPILAHVPTLHPKQHCCAVGKPCERSRLARRRARLPT